MKVPLLSSFNSEKKKIEPKFFPRTKYLIFKEITPWAQLFTKHPVFLYYIGTFTYDFHLGKGITTPFYTRMPEYWITIPLHS